MNYRCQVSHPDDVLVKVTRAILSTTSSPDSPCLSYLEALDPLSQPRLSTSGGDTDYGTFSNDDASSKKHRRSFSRGSFEIFTSPNYPLANWKFVQDVDELCQTRSKNAVFCGFTENPITFPPRQVMYYLLSFEQNNFCGCADHLLVRMGIIFLNRLASEGSDQALVT